MRTSLCMFKSAFFSLIPSSKIPVVKSAVFFTHSSISAKNRSHININSQDHAPSSKLRKYGQTFIRLGGGGTEAKEKKKFREALSLFHLIAR